MNAFALLLSLISSFRVRETDVTLPNKLLIFLVKMKLGICFTSIGILFGVHRTTASRIFFLTLNVLTHATQDFVPSAEDIRLSISKCFSVHYPRCKFNIDCTKVRIETPDTHERQRAFFQAIMLSHRQILGCSVSELHGQLCIERLRRAHIRLHGNVDSGFLNHVNSGDEIVADKGFPTIRTSIAEKKALLIMTHFFSGQQFMEEEMMNR